MAGLFIALALMAATLFFPNAATIKNIKDGCEIGQTVEIHGKQYVCKRIDQ